MTARRAIAVVCLLAGGCGEATVRQFRVGEHRVDARVPAGWDALEQGRQVVFRSQQEELVLVLSDLGPARPSAFRDEIERVAELWRAGDETAARTRLHALPLRAELFESREDADRMREASYAALSAPKGFGYDEVAAQLDELLAAADQMQPPSIDRIVDDSLPRAGHDQSRREVKTRQARSVAGREAMAVETWMTLTHADVRRFLVVVNDGRVLVLRCERCQEKASRAFDTVASSLQFAPASRT